MKLYKTIAVIWTDYDPAELQLSDLAREAETGDAYCSYQHAEAVENPEDDERAPDMEFFATEDRLSSWRGAQGDRLCSQTYRTNQIRIR